MARKVFFSFHFDNDHWRASQVRNIGVVERDEPVSGNDWEALKRKGDEAIKTWINNQISGTSCIVVLIGTETSQRPWVNYEIRRGWDSRKGVLGIHIHKLLNSKGFAANKGANPFDAISMQNGGKLSAYAPVYDPAGATSQAVYATIQANLEAWVENAIRARG